MTRTQHHTQVVSFLKHLQHDFNLSMRTLGHVAGVDPAHLSRVLEGKHKFHPRTVSDILEKIGALDEGKWVGPGAKARALREAGKNVS
jgi:hypothetical protein